MLARSAFMVRMLDIPVTSHIGPKPVFLETLHLTTTLLPAYW
jgi:hypothetical protein